MTPRRYFKSLSTLQGIFIGSLLLVAGIGYAWRTALLSGPFAISDKHLSDLLWQTVVGVFLICVIGTYYAFRVIVKRCRNKPYIIERLEGYRGAVIVRDALAVVPANFAVVVSVLTGRSGSWIAVTAMLITLLIWWPARSTVKARLNLDNDPRFQNPDTNLNALQGF